MLKGIDLLIILGYLLTTMFIGLRTRARAQKNTGNYLLGGKAISWVRLGLSNASGMFDISGTIWLVTLLFVYGIKSAWIPWLWPIFNQVFAMVYLSKWLRRSDVTTGAEWIRTRFGYKKGARRAHNIVVAFALLSCMGFLAYGFIGIGKFMEIFIPWEVVGAYLPFDISPEYVPHFYGIVFTLFASFYTLLGGMTGIVWTDILQFGMMTIAAAFIGYMGYTAVGEQVLRVPDGWMNLSFGWNLDLDWSRIIPMVNDKIREDGFNLFGIFFMMMVFKGILVSLAGPAPNYDLQKILSTRSPAEASKMSGFVSVVLMPVRYLMIAGFAALALVYYEQINILTPSGQVDFELILPAAIRGFAPVGLLGLIVAGLLAAFMSTFAGTLNAAQAYLINDVYLNLVPHTGRMKWQKLINYGSGILVAGAGIILGFFVENVNSVLQWLVSALFGSYIMANVLKWYWWRFNGTGFYWGMMAGMVPALLLPLLLPDTLDLYYFPVLLATSLLGCILGTYRRPPTEMAVLKEFYLKVRPWGFWKPVYDTLQKEYPDLAKNTRFGRDMFNICLGIAAQTSLVLLPMFLIFHRYTSLCITLFVLLCCFTGLKKYWWDTLHEGPGE